jgi:hypothetical protein
MVTEATLRYVFGKIAIDMLCQMHEIASFNDANFGNISSMADNELGYVYGKMAIDMMCQIRDEENELKKAPAALWI